jgi:hypothetical protein
MPPLHRTSPSSVRLARGADSANYTDPHGGERGTPEQRSVSPVFTPEALAGRWATTADVICAMCRDGRLRAFKVGREWRIALSAVEAVERGEVAA